MASASDRSEVEAVAKAAAIAATLLLRATGERRIWLCGGGALTLRPAIEAVAADPAKLAFAADAETPALEGIRRLCGCQNATRSGVEQPLRAKPKPGRSRRRCG